MKTIFSFDNFHYVISILDWKFFTQIKIEHWLGTGFILNVTMNSKINEGSKSVIMQYVFNKISLIKSFYNRPQNNINMISLHVFQSLVWHFCIERWIRRFQILNVKDKSGTSNFAIIQISYIYISLSNIISYVLDLFSYESIRLQ